MTIWFIVIGAILILMALLGSIVERLPLSTGLVYLAIGVALGPAATGLLTLDPFDDAANLELLFRIAVLVSLFTVGLKLRVPSAGVDARIWRLPIRLAGPAMLVTIAVVAVFAVLALNLSWGAAILLGAILAPTDPVLASDIQVRHEDDRDRARFALSAEGGLNDATASPFVLLGLGLLGLHALGPAGAQWFAVDLLWGGAAGFGIGWLCGLGVGSLILAMRRHYAEAYGLEEFLSLGLIALSYGAAEWLRGIGFLAVLAAGLAMRRLESRAARESGRVAAATPGPGAASLPAHAPAHMVGGVLDFNERFERIAEVASVLVLGGLLSAGYFSLEGLIVALVLFVIARPLSVLTVIVGLGASTRQKKLVSWFGIRGVGTLYYLMFAIRNDAPHALMERFVPMVLTVVAASIVVHGVSATPLMRRYDRKKARARAE